MGAPRGNARRAALHRSTDRAPVCQDRTPSDIAAAGVPWIEHVKCHSFARPRSLTVRVPMLLRRPSFSHLCRSWEEIERMSSASLGSTGRSATLTSNCRMCSEAARNASGSTPGAHSVTRPTSTVTPSRKAEGSRRRSSFSSLAVRTDDPRVADDGNGHSASKGPASWEAKSRKTLPIHARAPPVGAHSHRGPAARRTAFRARPGGLRTARDHRPRRQPRSPLRSDGFVGCTLG